MFKPSIPRKNPGTPPRHCCHMSSLCGELEPHTTDQHGLKLRLTTRFRDLLASEKYTVEASQAEMFFDICEAEVVPVRDEHVAAEDGAKFRVPSWQISDFESFLQSYDLSYQSYYLKLHREEGRKRSKQDDQVPVSCIGKPLIYDYSFMNEFSANGKFRFNILWLSPTVFVSPLLLKLTLDANPSIVSGWELIPSGVAGTSSWKCIRFHHSRLDCSSKNRRRCRLLSCD
jgi:hypothetical protein